MSEHLSTPPAWGARPFLAALTVGLVLAAMAASGPAGPTSAPSTLLPHPSPSSREFTLYRIPTPDGRAHYTDRKPPRGVKYQVVGDYQRLSRPVNLRGGRRKIYVYYPNGEERIGQRILTEVWYALRLNERIAGFPFYWRGDVKIFRVPESEIGSAAQHRGREGILTSGSHPYLMYHEIAHYWVNTDLYRPRWLVEGFAELYACLVGSRVRGRASAAKFHRWKLKAILDYPGEDFPLVEWDFGQPSTLARERFAYGKAFVACSLLMRHFSLYRLQQVNRIIRRQGRPVNTTQYLALLRRVAGRRVRTDPAELLSGWILPGRYWLKGKPVSLREYLRYLEHRPPRVPGRLDPSRPDAVHPSPPAPPSTSRPHGFFVNPQ